MPHSLRKTLIAMLMRSVHSPQQVQLRTGQKSFDILTSYVTTGAEEGRKQQRNILPSQARTNPTNSDNEKEIGCSGLNDYILKVESETKSYRIQRSHVS